MGFQLPTVASLSIKALSSAHCLACKEGNRRCSCWNYGSLTIEMVATLLSKMEASNCQKFGHQPSIFSSLLGSLILATSLLFLL